jgi:hypothetical protein
MKKRHRGNDTGGGTRESAKNVPAPELKRAAASDGEGFFLLAWLVRRRHELGILVLYAFILVVRAPWILFTGRIWAEEGTVYLKYAWTHPFFDALVSPHLGYYTLVPNVAGIVAAHVPLETAPCAMAAIALMVQMIPAGLVLFTPIPGLETPVRKGLALLLLLVVPANPEIGLSSVASHFVLCAATGLILVSEEGGRLDRYGKRAVLLLGGLNGVVSTFLAPFFWLRWWQGHRREVLIQAAILTACAVLQVMYVFRAVSDEERHIRVSPTVMTGAAYAKVVAMPLALVKPMGQDLEVIRQDLVRTGDLPAWVWLVTGAAFGIVGFVCWKSGNRGALMLAGAAVWLIVLASPGSREAATAEKLTFHLTTGAMRYYYAAEVFFFLGLLMASGSNRLPFPVRLFCGAWVGAAVLMGLINYARAPLDWPTFYFGPSWPAQVAQWHNDPSKPLEIWPTGWEMTLPPNP